MQDVSPFRDGSKETNKKDGEKVEDESSVDLRVELFVSSRAFMPLTE